MFTGIVEEIGTINSITKSGKTLQLNIAAKKILTDVKLGDSIAVNGVCLTVTKFSTSNFTADVMPVTYNITTLHNLIKLKLQCKLIMNINFHLIHQLKF
jgi:riboflavin synthase